MFSKLFGDKGIEQISASKLNAKLKNVSKPVLLDVREASELVSNIGKIDGIVHIPVGSLVGRISELEKYKDEEIVIICLSGHRSMTAAKLLKKERFEKVAVLTGGMQAWRREGY